MKQDKPNSGKKIEDYLHLYLGCKVMLASVDDSPEPNIRTLSGIDNAFEYPVRLQIGDYVSAHMFEDVKPILRPLSDMTEEERKEFQLICGLEKEDLGCIIFEPYYFNIELKELGTAHLTNVLQWANGVNYLRKIFVDVDELIEVGLAIDATTLKK